MNLSPRNAKTFKQLCSLRTDNTQSKTSWILLDVGTVHIHNQKNGENSTGEVTLTRREFNQFVDWYNGQQKVRRKTK
jgi:hypothetical protein